MLRADGRLSRAPDALGEQADALRRRMLLVRRIGPGSLRARTRRELGDGSGSWSGRHQPTGGSAEPLCHPAGFGNLDVFHGVETEHDGSLFVRVPVLADLHVGQGDRAQDTVEASKVLVVLTKTADDHVHIVVGEDEVDLLSTIRLIASVYSVSSAPRGTRQLLSANDWAKSYLSILVPTMNRS